MKAILTDVTKCIGCELCVEKCREINKLGEDFPWPWQPSVDSLSASRWTTVLRLARDHFVRKHCQHCLDPACVTACPVGALKKTREGAVIYDVSVCIGCRYCMNACPFGIPKYNWQDPAPAIQKCNLCYPRITKGQEPGCTEVCPTKATIFGEREDLIAEAKRRIAEDPGRYIHKVWGEDVVGGTSVLYISDVDLGLLGWRPDLGKRPLPLLTWQILNKVPGVLLTVAGLMLGAYWLYGRKNRVQEETKKMVQGGNDSDGGHETS